MKQAPLSQEEYTQYMDDLMDKVLSILHGEHAMEIAGIGMGLLVSSLSQSPPEARLEIGKWMRRVLDATQPSVH
jgi:hypothetical protein